MLQIYNEDDFFRAYTDLIRFGEQEILGKETEWHECMLDEELTQVFTQTADILSDLNYPSTLGDTYRFNVMRLLLNEVLPDITIDKVNEELLPYIKEI